MDNVTISEQLRMLGRAQRLLGGARERLIEADAEDVALFKTLESKLTMFEEDVRSLEDQLVALGLLAEADRTPTIVGAK